jgi:hypothetical protein
MAEATMEPAKPKIWAKAKTDSTENLVDSTGEANKEEESSCEETDFSLHSKATSKTSKRNTAGNKRNIDDVNKERKRRKQLEIEIEATKKVNELQDQKTDKVIEMLTNYEKDQALFLERINLMAKQLNKLEGYTSDDNAKESAIGLPSNKNEEVFKVLVQLDTEQQSIANLLSTQTVPPEHTSNPVIATSNQAEPPNENSTRAEPPNSLNRTDVTNALTTTIKETPSKHIAPENKSDYVHGDKTTTEEEVLSNEDLRISLLTDDELNKEVVALMKAMRFDDAKELLQRHKELNNK